MGVRLGPQVTIANNLQQLLARAAGSGQTAQAEDLRNWPRTTIAMSPVDVDAPAHDGHSDEARAVGYIANLCGGRGRGLPAPHTRDETLAA